MNDDSDFIETVGAGISPDAIEPFEGASGRHHHRWEDRLRSGFGNRRLRLPSPGERLNSEGKLVPGMRVFGYHDEAHIVLNAAAVTANMQEDAAAFEGWALALHRWAGAARVRLSWTTQRDSRNRMSPHEERLAYRARRFEELFPEWFKVEGDATGSWSLDAAQTARRLLNTPAKREGLRETSRAAATALGKWTSEREMECSLRHDPIFSDHFGLSRARRDQQFPVGLFGPPLGVSKPRGSDRIFPGGKGAIDLVAADGKRFWLFELKARDNTPMGGLSELLFYASVLRDAARGHFEFAQGAWAECDVKGEDILTANEIVAVLLADKLHPLLRDAGLWQDLNRAVEERWVGEGPMVEFRAATTSDGSFRDIQPWR